MYLFMAVILHLGRAETSCNKYEIDVQDVGFYIYKTGRIIGTNKQPKCTASKFNTEDQSNDKIVTRD